MCEGSCGLLSCSQVASVVTCGAGKIFLVNAIYEDTDSFYQKFGYIQLSSGEPWLFYR